MKCCFCQSPKIRVTDKRNSDSNTIRRRRQCIKCKKRFTTYERIELTNVLVIKKDGRREQYDREKLKSGIIKACEKRAISADKIERMVDSIEIEIKNKNLKEVKSEMVGEFVMKKLKRLDKVAYIRFASVYRSFTDLDSFGDELKKLIRESKAR